MITPRAVDVAQALAAGNVTVLEFTLTGRRGTIESLPFPGETFDAVTSSLMMHHLTERLRVKGLAEIWHVLRPGGWILVADMMLPSGSSFKRFFTSVILHHGHVVEFGQQDVAVLLRKAGFEAAQQLDARFLVIRFVAADLPLQTRIVRCEDQRERHIIPCRSNSP